MCGGRGREGESGDRQRREETRRSFWPGVRGPKEKSWVERKTTQMGLQDEVGRVSSRSGGEARGELGVQRAEAGAERVGDPNPPSRGRG